MGASIYVDGVPAGSTPTTLEVKRKRAHLLTLTKAGYEDETVRLEPVLSGAVAGNIIAGGFIGWGIDACNGSQYRLIPEAIQVRMRPSIYSADYPNNTSFQAPYMYQNNFQEMPCFCQ